MASVIDLPTHVPTDRVVDFDIFNPPGAEQDYFAAWKQLQRPGGPKIVWTTANGGHWIAVDGETVRSMWADAARLSNEVLAVTPGLGEVMRFIPLQQDGAEHAMFRKAVMKGFASRFIIELEPRVRYVTRELIEELRPLGQCDFVTEFAEVLPLVIFLTLIGVPTDDRKHLRELGKQLTRPDGSMTVEGLKQAADDYLWPFIEERKREPGDDLLSRIMNEPIDGREWSDDERRRMSSNIFFAGLDTVASTIGMVVLHLARHPQDQALLRERRELIPGATDELMRRYPIVSVSRNALVDVEVDGVTVRAGDIVYLPAILHNLDPACFDDPEKVDFERALNPTRHTGMGAGPHRCVGAGLARMEVIAFLDEWMTHMPEVRLDPAKPVTMRAGNVGACMSIPLVWQP